MKTTGPWPPTDSRSVLTESALLEMWDPGYGFRKMIREADEVEVKASPYVDRDNIYALDPTKGSLPMDGPVYVICHPDHEEVARAEVAKLRRATLDPEDTP